MSKTQARFSSLSAVVDGVTLFNEGSTAVASQPPKVVSLAPVRCTPGVNDLGGQEDHEGQDDEEHQEFEHFECSCFGILKNVNISITIRVVKDFCELVD